MKNKLIMAVFAVGIGAIAYWLISPLFIDKKVNEKLEDIVVETSPTETEKDMKIQEGLSIVSSGSFSGLANHNASGSAKIIKAEGKYFLRFEDDFMSTNGPDVRVYFGKNNQYEPNTELGVVKGNIGGQNYEIPASINVAEYNEVWLWCKAFSVPFGKAELK